MKKFQIQNSEKGFTLIEILVVLGLVTIVASLGLFVSMDSYNNSSFRNDRDLLITTLMHARSEAINNVCISTSAIPCTDGIEHGVHIDSTGGVVQQFIIFQGTNYAVADPATFETIKTNHFMQDTGATDVYFSQLSGNAGGTTFPVVIKIQDNNGDASDISIGKEGQIYWTR